MATCLSTDDIYTDVQSLYSQMEEENLDDGEFESLLLLRSDFNEKDLSSQSKDLLSNIRDHMKPIIEKLRKKPPDQIKNKEEAEEIRMLIQDINKKVDLLSSIPNNIEKIENSSIILEPLKKDLEIIQSMTQTKNKQLKLLLTQYHNALQRVKRSNDLHETRGTTKIIEGSKNIPEHFFKDTPISKEKGAKSKSQPSLPWQYPDNEKEDENLENTLKIMERNQSIQEYIITNKLVPDADKIGLEEMLNSLNYQLSQLGIQLNANDSELEEKIIYIHRNTGWLNTGQYDKKFDTNQTNQQITYNPNNNPRQPNTMQHQTPNTNPRKTEDNIEKWSFVHDQNNQADNSIYYTPASSYEQLHSSQYKTSFFTPTNEFDTKNTLLQRRREILMRQDTIPQTNINPNDKYNNFIQKVKLFEETNNTDIEEHTSNSNISRPNKEMINNPYARIREPKKIQFADEINYKTLSETKKLFSKNQEIEKGFERQNNSNNQKDSQYIDMSKYPETKCENVDQKKYAPNMQISKSTVNKIRKLQVEMDNLEESTDNVERIINRIKNIETFNFQELQDLSSKLTDYYKLSRTHKKSQMDFKKELIDLEDQIKIYDELIYVEMEEKSDLANRSAKKFSQALKEAEDKIIEEKITNVNVSTLDAKEVVYQDFSGGQSITDKNIYEVLKNHESNHKLNRTSNYLKGIILKKHLKGSAKLIIGDDITNYEDIKEALIRRYGNINELLTSLYHHHQKIGANPPRTGSFVMWNKINESCKSHLTLIRRADLLLKNTNNSIINEKYVTDLIKFLCPEDRYEILAKKEQPLLAYKLIKEKFNTILDMSQEMMRLNPKINHIPKKKNQDPIPGTSEFGLVANYDIMPAKDCKICNILQDQGELQGFFENHLQNKNTGSFYNAQCPLYLKMTMQSRLDFLKSNQFCVYCVNPLSITHKIESCKQKNLSIKNNRQPPYVCRTMGCPNRLELCLVHKDTNMSALTRRKENLDKNNIEMCLLTLPNEDNISNCSTRAINTSCEKVSHWLNSITLYNESSSESNQFNEAVELCQSKSSDHERPLLVKHKETLLNQQDVVALNSQTRPLFMYMKVRGHTRGVSLVFDSGSSAVVCTDAIPGKELKACRLENQTVKLQGLGDSKKAAKSWTILLPLNDGTHVATSAYSVPHILGPLSPVNLAPAHQLIKNAAPNDIEIQRSQVYNYLAGNIEILAGIRLNSLFPEKVFQMTNGLALYKLKLASHDRGKSFCLGGPYEVINEMKEIFNESANFLNEIDNGLEQWRSGNTPYIKRVLTPIPYDDYIEESIGIMMEDGEITDDDLEEIDNYLDSLNYTNECQEINFFINTEDPEANIDENKEESIKNISTTDEEETENNSSITNSDKSFSSTLVIEITNLRLQSYFTRLQKEIQLINNTKFEIEPRKKLFVEIMDIEITRWNETIKSLRDTTKRIRLESIDLKFQEQLTYNQDGTIAVKIEETSLMKLLNHQKQLFENLERLKNVKAIKHTTLSLKLLKSKYSEHIKLPTIRIAPTFQKVKNITLFPKREHASINHNKMILKIKLRSNEYVNMEKVNVADVTDIASLDNTPFAQPHNEEVTKTQNINNIKDVNMIKNIELIIDGPKVGFKCTNCLNCNKCKENPNQNKISMKEQLESYLIEKSVTINHKDKYFLAKLPLIYNPEETLETNYNETKIRLKKVLQRLNKDKEECAKIKQVFDKLKELRYIIKKSDLPENIQQKINTSKVKYFIPWNYVSKSTSITTEKRQVYDASAKTSSGNSLNDILSKGCPKMDFDTVLLNFVSKKYAIAGDIMKFYQSVKLHEDHYHLQMMLWTDSMEPNEEPEEYVITRLTFGLKSSSQQLEHCIDLLAEENKHNTQMYRTLKLGRYVDDIMDSFDTEQEVESLKVNLIETLQKYGMKLKAFASSYEKPPKTISDGTSLVVGGYIWITELDILFIRIQPLHYAEKQRGKIMTENIFMEGTKQELEQFVPQNLTLRQVLSRGAQIYDPLGLITPWKTGLKILTRETLESVKKDWDVPLSKEFRDRWIKKFWDMQEIKQIGFKRCPIPLNSTINQLSLICFCDAGKHAKIQVVYLLHEDENTVHHVQLLYSKSQLIQPNKTLANMELDSMNAGAELLNKCYRALPNIKKICLVGDSQITSYWIAKDTISLATFQRNRVSNIRRLINLGDIYRCKGSENVADIGTKGEIGIADSIPGSKFHSGPNWLKQGIDQSVKSGHLIPIQNISIDPKDKKTWNMAADGLIGKCKWPEELLIRNKTMELPILSINLRWVNQVKERYDYSNYLIDPLKKEWPTIVDSLSIVFYFIHRTLSKILDKPVISIEKMKRWKTVHQKITDIKKETDYYDLCQTLSSLLMRKQNPIPNQKITDNKNAIKLCEQAKHSPNSLIQSIDTILEKTKTKPKQHKLLNMLDLFKDGITANFFKSIAILYLLKKGAKELEAFYKNSMIKKHCLKAGNLYFSKNRWLMANQLREIDNENINLADFQIQELAPVLDRHSPTAISLALFFHQKVAKHAGADRSHLSIQGSIFIFQGQKLFEDICRDCITCRIKLKQKYNQIMGPLGREQITYSAVGRFLFLDMSGPYEVKSTINARSTRNKSGNIKVWLLHGVCVISNYSLVQVLESYSTESFVQAVHRMSTYISYPQIAFIDPSQTETKGLTKTKFSMYNAANQLYEETGITIKTCGVGPQSHSRNGLVERRVALFKRYFEICRIHISDLSPLGLYTLATQAAAHLNATPLCTKRRNGSTISSKMITPNCFILGKRSNLRAPADIPYLTEDRNEIIEKLQKASKGMLTFFQVNIPDLLLRTCWTQESNCEITRGDLVLFIKDDSAVHQKWKLGIVYEMEFDSDGETRIIQITYVNKDEITLPLSKEEHQETSIIKRITRKAVHTVVKIHSINDDGINKDLAFLNRLLHNKSISNDQDNISDIVLTAVPKIAFLNIDY